MNKSYSKHFFILLSLFCFLVLILPQVAKAGSDTDSYDFHCGRHGHNDSRDCGYSWSKPWQYPRWDYYAGSTAFQFLGHRHGGSSIVAYTGISGSRGEGRGQWFFCSGDDCGYEYGGEHPFNFLDGGSFTVWSNSGSGSNFRTVQYARVMDAEVRVVGSVSMDYPDVYYGCTDPSAANYNPSANTNDGSCYYVVTVACVIRDINNNQPISGATCSIAGQSGTTNGDGYRAFNNVRTGTQTLGVSKSGYNSYSGSYQISRNTDLVVHLTPSVYQCSGSSSRTCTSGANACGQTANGTQTRTCNTNNGTWSAWGSCSATTPRNPAGYGNACVSAPNVCGQTGAGTIQCNGRCSATTPPASSCAAPTASISASPNSVNYGGSSIISWSSTNSSSCSVPGIGSGLSGSGSTGGLTSNRTYTATCTGFNASQVSNSVLVNVAPPFNYSLSNSGNSSVTKTSGNAFTQNTITKNLVAGATESVSLSLSGVPSATSYSISNGSCSPACTSVITFTVAPTAPVGTHSITVTGAPLSKQTSFSLIISGNPATVSCSASPSPAFLGQQVTWTATVTGGTPPFTYAWSGTNIPTNPAPSTNPYRITYNSIGLKTAIMTVTDSDNLQAACPGSGGNGSVYVNFDPTFEEF